MVNKIRSHELVRFSLGSEDSSACAFPGSLHVAIGCLISIVLHSYRYKSLARTRLKKDVRGDGKLGSNELPNLRLITNDHVDDILKQYNNYDDDLT